MPKKIKITKKAAEKAVVAEEPLEPVVEVPEEVKEESIPKVSRYYQQHPNRKAGYGIS